jgi:hypothetical protein
LLVIVPAGVLGIAATGQLPVPAAWPWGATAIYLAASLAGLYGAVQKSEKNVVKQKLITGK